MRITKSIETVRIAYKGKICTAKTDGTKTETMCGIVAKGVSGHTPVFKTVGMKDSTMPDCLACAQAAIDMEMTE